TTFGTPLYRDNVPSEDAPMVERMKRAGAIMLGKTNTPTFGWIGATHNLLFGPTRNPWNLERTPGGSSGGASAAAAAGLGPLHIGTDGGGSIRIPASCAGIFGHKPSYGRIPTHPASGAWSLSHIGPLTRTVADAALMLTVGAGRNLLRRHRDADGAVRRSARRHRAGTLPDHRDHPQESAHEIRAGVVRPARLVAAPARVLREVRSAADAHDRVPAIRRGARQSGDD